MQGSATPEVAPAAPRSGLRAAPARSRAEAPARSAAPALAAILLAGLSLRVGVAFCAGLEWLTPDSRSYLRMADGILAGRPLALFANGYPLLIAALKCAVPEPRVPAVLIGINAAAATLSIGLVYAIARQVGMPRHTALVAAALQAVYPNQLVYMHYVLTESLATCFLLGGSLALLRRRDALGGGLLAVAVAFRSSLAPVLPLAGLVLAWRSGLFAAAARFAAGAGLVGALYGGGLAAGTIRPSDIARINLLFSIHSTSTNFEFSNAGFSAEERRHPLRTYLRFAAEQPGAFAVQRASSLWELWGPYPTDLERPVWKRLLLGLRCPLLLLACVAVARGWRRWEVALLALPVAVNSAVHVAFYSHPRYSYVSEPLVILLATSVAVPWLLARAGAARGRPAAAPA